MFQRIVAIEPINLTACWEKRIFRYARDVRLYTDIPESNEEIIRRIGDADCVLLSYTGRIDKEVLLSCPSIRYIGMCCSLYSPESANVDIPTAHELGITVSGVRDYGDEGVAEYVVSELVRLLHGFGTVMWKDAPIELTNLDIGIIGMGTTGGIIARALRFFGANIYYYSRTRKYELEKWNRYIYLPLHDLLQKVEIACTCLNKNVVLLGEAEFEAFGNGKILVNTSIGPSHRMPDTLKWLEQPGNYLLSDTVAGVGSNEMLLTLPNVLVAGRSAGMTTLAKDRLGKKVISNIEAYLY